MIPRAHFRLGVIALLALVLAAGAIGSGATTAVAASSLNLSRYTAAPNDSLTVQGHGFTAQDSVVVAADLQVNSHFYRLQTSTLNDGSGAFQVTLKLPGGTNQGTFPVYARDFHGNFASRKLTVLPLAYVQVGGGISTTYVLPTHGFYISGAGFNAFESVHITAAFPQYDGNVITVTRTVQASSTGAFYEASMTVPSDAQTGTVTLNAVGLSSHKVARNHLAVVYRPTLVQPRTARPGTPVTIDGRGFVPASVVRVSLTIPRTGDTTETLSRNVTTDGHGDFSTSLDLPSNVRLGKYTVGAFDTVGHFSASTTLLVSVRPTIAVSPGTVLPGEAFTVSGDNFGSAAHVTVSASSPVQGGGSHTVTGGTQTGGRGEYSVRLVTPGNAAPGQATVVARASNASVSTKIRVQARPTPTPRPTNLPTATPTPTPTVTPTPIPPKKVQFGFRSISVWYHTVRAGTWDHVVIQSKLKTVQGMWVTVRFASGVKFAVYTLTNQNGHYQRTFNVPKNATNGSAADALITFKLWHGSKSKTAYRTITVVP